MDIQIAKNVSLLTSVNPEYKTLVQYESHLRGTIALYFSWSKQRLKNKDMPARNGKIGKPVSELTKFGWMITSQGQGDHSNVYLTQSTTHDYEHLYQLHVLGLDNTSNVINVLSIQNLKSNSKPKNVGTKVPNLVTMETKPS